MKFLKLTGRWHPTQETSEFFSPAEKILYMVDRRNSDPEFPTIIHLPEYEPVEVSMLVEDILSPGAHVIDSWALRRSVELEPGSHNLQIHTGS